MNDPKGNPLRSAAELVVLREFWPTLADDRPSLSFSVGLDVAGEVLGRTIDYSQVSSATSPGGFRMRMREKACYPTAVEVTEAQNPGLFRNVKEAVALLPVGILERLGMGADLCFATYREPMLENQRTGTRNMDEHHREWRILLGHETVGAPDAAVRGMVIHELLHIVIGKSPAFQPLWRARSSIDEDAARNANLLIEEKVVRLACELGLVDETRMYLRHMASIHPDDPNNARFTEIAESYQRAD